MNIAFFLTPKNEVIYEKPSSTMRQALERMEYHRYSAVPLVNKKGNYVGTLTEGDLLWKLKNTPNLSFNDTSKILIEDIPRHICNTPVLINSDIESLISLAKDQNFVPVVDDNNIFIGIIKRSDIISYCFNLLYDNNETKSFKLIAT
ncbi:CBS domain-containing protein [Clostridium tagluense]|uniref:CBS domain-containing protein n=1 Tax=Clostridium TaxID=1485 RepID=UPI0013E90ECD|nr:MULTISPECIES: CBS domain-containing protein [Clostridium]MBU3128037.1 CBS domain-containing protein [Clostridium tagluense]MBW9156710.1 CBS domain-containing protein [Clostridium tagluense]MBZ9625077.1 CBS domain-containing protein [Clostridium sp. FP2]MCB2296891.1 CBS domain-containing protein [Clostridium tagluense]MCB2311826.1 CBS domain-containing protein [Clostridium tagluense]